MGRTALREAASGCFGLPIVKYLVEHGADVNVYREVSVVISILRHLDCSLYLLS